MTITLDREVSVARARSGGRGPSQDEWEDENRRLLEAARTVLMRTGWWGFKVGSVLREARLSTRGFYRQFAAKSELLLAVLEHETERFVSRLRVIAVAGGDPRARLSSWVDACLDLMSQDDFARPVALFAERWRALLGEYPDRVQALVDAVVGTISPIVADGRDAGLWPCARPDEDAVCIYYLLSSMTADITVAGLRPDRDAMARTVMPFVLRALGDDPSTDPAAARLCPARDAPWC